MELISLMLQSYDKNPLSDENKIKRNKLYDKLHFSIHILKYCEKSVLIKLGRKINFQTTVFFPSSANREIRGIEVFLFMVVSRTYLLTNLFFKAPF